MPYCYANGGGYGRFLERREQPLVVDMAASCSVPASRVREKGSTGAVLCVETGETFMSAEVAGISVGRAASSIKSAVNKGSECAGRHWLYVMDGASRRA